MDAENNFLKEFLCCLEMKRCLWDITSPGYMLRDVKNKAYEDMLSIMQKYKKNGTIEDVKKKINTIRSSYRRELKKIKLSESSGAGANNVYQPKIWWFDSCQFLRRYEQPIGGITTLSDEDTLHDTTSSDQGNDESSYEPPTKIKKPKKQQEVVDLAMSYLQKETDSFEHFGLAWAAKLRKMKPTQSKLAERLIAEILFQGDLEMLTMDTTVENRRPKSTEASSSYSRSSTPHEYIADRHFSVITQLPTTSNTNTCSVPFTPQHVSPPIFSSSFQEPVTHIEQIEHTQDNQFTNIRDFIYTFKE